MTRQELDKLKEIILRLHFALLETKEPRTLGALADAIYEAKQLYKEGSENLSGVPPS